MNILIANLGSTSFKYRLYKIEGGQESPVADGSYESVTNYADVINDALSNLTSGGHINAISDIDAVGFKTVLGKDLSGCVDDEEAIIAALEGFKEVAPAHNPPYAQGIKQFRELLPDARLVALFETAFYQWIPEAATRYAVPKEWHDIGIRRYGFHGASHKFIAERSAELMEREDVAQNVRKLYADGPQEISGDPLRVISFHLGGSSSVTGIKNGVAVGTSMGFSPQSGLPQNNRVGDLDSGAIPYAMKKLGLTIDEAVHQLTKESGFLGTSGLSNDMRNVQIKAEDEGDATCQMSLDIFIKSCRNWASSYLFELGGLDTIVFTAGIGENDAWTREEVCKGLEEFGVKIDPVKNKVRGKETLISADDSKVKVFVIPTNEELVLVREVHQKVTS